MNNLIKNLSALMLGIIIALLLGEAFVRIFLDLPNKDYRKLFVSDQSVGYKMQSNFVGTQGPVRLFTNDNGHRILGNQNKEETEYDIVVFGDSFVFGHLTEYENTFVNLINEKTKSKVLNAGVSGYNLDQIHNAAKEYLELNNPKVVIVSIHVASDITSQIHQDVNWLKVVYGSLFRTDDPSDYYEYVLRSFLSHYSDLYYWAFEMKIKQIYHKLNILYKKEDVINIDEQIYIEEDIKELEIRKIKFDDFIVKFQGLINSNTVLIFLLIPSINDLKHFEEISDYNNALLVLNDREAIIIDLREYFKNNYSNLIISNNDRHWNNKGHKLVGDVIHNKLMELLLIEEIDN